MNNSEERKRRQKKLANLFFEMGMDLDLIEKVSGVDRNEILNGKSKEVSLTINDYNSSMYIENRNSY